MNRTLTASKLSIGLAVLFALVASSLLFSTGPAHAGSAYGAYKSFSAGKAKYQARSWVVTQKGKDRAATNISSKSGNQATGHLGAIARGYKANNALACTSGYSYNSRGSSSGLAVSCGFWAKKGVSYYSQGSVKAWEGGGKYKTVTPVASPRQTGG